MCFLYTPNRRLSHFSAVLSASLSRALTTVLLCLLPSCLPAMKRGRDNAGVEEISPRFYPRHRFEGSTSCLVISMEGRILFFLFPLAANRIFFSPPVDKHADKNFAKSPSTRERICRVARSSNFVIVISHSRQGYRSINSRRLERGVRETDQVRGTGRKERGEEEKGKQRPARAGRNSEMVDLMKSCREN